VYIGSNDSKIYALDGETGDKLWEFSTGNHVWSSPSIGSDGTIYVGSNDNKLYAIDPRDGTKKWEFTTGGGIWTSPVVSSKGLIYFGSRDKKIYAVDGMVESNLDPWPMFGRNLFHRNQIPITESELPPSTDTETNLFSNAGIETKGGWRELEWFGEFYPTVLNWTYHLEHGWLYSTSSSLNSLWYFDQSLGWCWTSPSVYPFLFRGSSEAWYFFQRNSLSPRRFYDFGVGAWVDVE